MLIVLVQDQDRQCVLLPSFRSKLTLSKPAQHANKDDQHPHRPAADQLDEDRERGRGGAEWVRERLGRENPEAGQRLGEGEIERNINTAGRQRQVGSGGGGGAKWSASLGVQNQFCARSGPVWGLDWGCMQPWVGGAQTLLARSSVTLYRTGRRTMYVIFDCFFYLFI